MLDLLSRDPTTLSIQYGERAKHLDAALSDYFAVRYPGLSERIDGLA